jgi:hypothetical protein
VPIQLFVADAADTSCVPDVSDVPDVTCVPDVADVPDVAVAGRIDELKQRNEPFRRIARLFNDFSFLFFTTIF